MSDDHSLATSITLLYGLDDTLDPATVVEVRVVVRAVRNGTDEFLVLVDERVLPADDVTVGPPVSM
ncbi:hypothetical protein ACFQPA_19105 [Halomarina halobia]|uniref:Uncharacterized protein n=1 Tax=Halomarina halobia TaxID=3033386 RepID=A0ABD6AE45_9EURY|nr:hypothetical protein [Halomarina sp. PSR21]